ncbi:FHA domain-containing protein [Hyphomicrobium sp.]|uniref:FHA domain-containing protein n=1 Tax=Hyphomicrobium sp. TaxID=82 RepID=UPI002E308F1D|nr:FHA domain-containing protein [Hyphomicrobium sp.]HEX2843239.1 FHA domain-containing protein [Hyphomicrobium sp.]
MPFQKRGTSGGFWRSLVLLAGILVAASLAPPASRAFDTRRVEPSVYKIYTFIPDKNNQYTISSGSGFLVSGHRHVVTNFHVVEGGTQFFVAYRDGREAKLVEARRANTRPNVDLALLETREDLPGEPLRLGEYEPEKLAEVVAIGFPGAANLNKELVPGPDARGVPLTDLDSTVTTGTVSRMTFTNLKVSDTQVLSARTVQHNSAINPGNSGGPLFDACGLVVGVNTLQGLNSQGLFFSIHANEVGRFLREGQIPFSSTTRPCSTGLGSGLIPLIIGLGATLALAAFAFALRTRRMPELVDALPKALARLTSPKGSDKNKGLRNLLRPSPDASGILGLRAVDGGAIVRLDESGKARTIGRGPGADIVVTADTVSKVHARLAYDRTSDRVRITDLNSSNGTYLNGARIAEAAASPGALLRFGTVEYAVVRESHSAKAERMSANSGWMLSGFDPSGRALQIELRPVTDPTSDRALPATWTFGRDPIRANFVIEDGSVSSLHAQLMYNPGEPLMLRDMGSMNGTRLDGEDIGKRTVTLSDTGHEIAFGLATLRLSRSTG